MRSPVVIFLFLAIRFAIPQTIRTTYICPDGFHLVERRCFYFGKEKVTWMDSHFSCRELNSTLLVLHSPKIQNVLKGFVTQDNHSTLDYSDRWIDGIYDWKVQHWNWGSTGEPIRENSFTKNNIGDNLRWHCLALSGTQNNKWLARKCTEKKSFICQAIGNVVIELMPHIKRERKFMLSECTNNKYLKVHERRRCAKLLGNVDFSPKSMQMGNHTKLGTKKKKYNEWICPSQMINLGNRCYVFSKNESTWTDAHFECKKNGSKLAILRNKAQDHNLRMFLNNFIENGTQRVAQHPFTAPHDRWIGGIYDWKKTEWRWAKNGKPLRYMGFKSEIIKKKSPKELTWNSIYMDPAIDNQWNVAKQTEKKHFICQVKAKAVKKITPIGKINGNATIAIIQN